DAVARSVRIGAAPRSFRKPRVAGSKTSALPDLPKGAVSAACRIPTEATAEVDRSGVRCRAAGSPIASFAVAQKGSLRGDLERWPSIPSPKRERVTHARYQDLENGALGHGLPERPGRP